jgi:hypothetical protein
MPRLCFVILDIVPDGIEGTGEGDDDKIDMFDTDGTRGRWKAVRPGMLSGVLERFDSTCELALAIVLTVEVTRETVEEVCDIRRELEPGLVRVSTLGDLFGTKGEGGTPRGASDTADFELRMVRLGRLRLSGEGGLD